MIIAPPSADKDFGFYNRYIFRVTDTDLVPALRKNLADLNELVVSLSQEQLAYRYDIDKWSIKEVIVHLVDAERNFCYRTMRISRGDQTELPVFDAHSFITNSHAAERDIKKIMHELEALREATIIMYDDMPLAMLDLEGLARNTMLSARALGYATIGHVMHHMEIIKERYLPQIAVANN
ncbi:MAG TPA: DinB family protein [Flavipsychrobacter sp.]|nr:DinB family protein [Flavipsychrobacter sp.]